MTKASSSSSRTLQQNRKDGLGFSLRAPNHLAARDVEQAFHGTHLECLHSLAASGRLLPSSGAIEGTRHFGNRPGVYLHRPARRRATLH